MVCGYHLSLPYIRVLPILNVYCSESLQSRNWISILMELILLFKLTYHRMPAWTIRMESSWCIGFRSKPFITYAWIAKAVEDGFMCQRQLCHCIRSKLRFLYRYTSIWKQYLQTWKPAHWVFCWRILQFKQRFLFSNFHLWKQKYKWCKSGIVQLSYMGMESKALNLGLECSKLHRACHFTSGIVMI